MNMRANKLFVLATALLFAGTNSQTPVNDEPGQLFEERDEGVTYYKSGGKVSFCAVYFTFSWEKSLNLCKVVFGQDSTLLNLNTPEKLNRTYELLSRENGEVISKRFWTDGAYDRETQTWRWNQGKGEDFGEFIEWEDSSQIKDENSRALIIINDQAERPIRFAFANKDVQYPYVCDTPNLLACS